MKKLLLAALIGATMGTVQAKDYKMIVNAGPGSGPDSVARAVRETFQKNTGHTVIIEYQSGGNAFNAANAFLNGSPSILLGNTALFVMNEVFNADITAYRDSDFNYVGLTARHPIVWYARADAGIISHNHLVSKLMDSNFKDGIGGDGLFNKLNTLILLDKYNSATRVVFVPYKTAGDALTGVLSGTHSIGTTAPNPSLMGQVRAGKVVILGTSWPGLVLDGTPIPNLGKTFGDQLTGLTALAVSKKFDQAEQDYLKEEFWKAMTDKETMSKINASGLVADPIPGKDLPKLFGDIKTKLIEFKNKFKLD